MFGIGLAVLYSLLILLSSLIRMYFRFRQVKDSFKAMSPWIGKAQQIIPLRYELFLFSV